MFSSSSSSSSSGYTDEPDSKKRKLNLFSFEGDLDSRPFYWLDKTAIISFEKTDSMYNKIIGILIRDGLDVTNYDISIECNCDLDRFNMYCQQKKTFMKGLGSDKVNERWLYHGTNLENVNSILINSFIREKNKEKRRLFGKGTYFSKSPNESLKYSSGQEKVLLLNRVLLGESCLGTKDKNSPDCKSNSHKMYESMVNKLQNPSIFVLSSGSDHQCYVEFIIKLKCKNSLMSNRERNTELHMKLLEHSHNCSDPKCSSSNCKKMKDLIKHSKSCSLGFFNCFECKQFKGLISFHSNRCNNKKCTIPNCVNNKGFSQTHLPQPRTPPPLQPRIFPPSYQYIQNQLILSQQEVGRLQHELNQQNKKALSNLDILRQQQSQLALGLKKLSEQQKLTTEKINAFSSDTHKNIEVEEDVHTFDNEKELDEDSDPDEDFYIPKDDYQKSKLIIKFHLTKKK